MEKRILAYRKKIDEILVLSDADWQEILNEHLTQIAFFQHERLIHLIVTVLFALLEVLALLGTVILGSGEVMSGSVIALGVLAVLLLVLLVPYIRHYYILENEVQKMYFQYDELLHRIRAKSEKKDI